MRLRIFLSLVVFGTLVTSAASAQQTAKITSSNIAYLEYVPQGYYSSTAQYPLVISLHGIKEKGTTSTDPATLKSSVQTVANVGLPKYVKFGKQYPFILVSPQLKSNYGTWPASYVMDVINHVKKTLRVDPNRIYITGLSLGGFGVWTTIGAYPSVFAGALPVCAGGNALSKASAIAAENIPVWGFHGDKDYIVSYTVTTKMVNAINASTPKPSPLAKATLFPGMGHVIWDKVYNETSALTWMLGFRNGSSTSAPAPAPTPTTNAAPVANAGRDLTITLPTNTVSVYGSATDSDGTIKSYYWTQVSGPSAASLTYRYTKTLKAMYLKAGTYTFRMKVTDDDGASATDDVRVVVNTSTSTSTSSAPIVSAGTDKTLLLPGTYTYISGTASDPDGIASWLWTKISGPSAGITGATGSRIRVYNLVAGTYTFRLTVKDTKGNVKSDDMILYVKSSSTTSTAGGTTSGGTTSTANKAPVVYAGADKTITLPTSSVKLYGNAKDYDGRVAHYVWSQHSGPTKTVISNSAYPTCTVNYLRQGTYYFKLTVKDDDGAVANDNVKVQVNDGNVSVIPVDDPLETSSTVEG